MTVHTMATESAHVAEALLPQNPPKHLKVHGNSASLFRHSCVWSIVVISKQTGVEISYIWLGFNANTFKHNFINLLMKYALLAIFVKQPRFY